MKKLAFLCLAALSCSSFCVQLSHEKMAQMRANLNENKTQTKKNETCYTALSLICGAASKIALLASVASMVRNQTRNALVYGGLSGFFEVCSNLATQKVIAAHTQHTNIMIAESILVNLSESITK